MLGVIGGLGPMATAYFMELVTEMTNAVCDQAHLPMLIYSAPQIPDRTAFLLGKSNADPLPGIIHAGCKLKEMGADVLAIPCITAHSFHDAIEAGVGLPTLHAIRDVAKRLAESDISRVGIMATDGTLQCRLFQNEFEKYGLTAILPDERGQTAVMDLIYGDIKRGNEPNMDAFHYIKNDLIANGAQIVLLGCTELSLIKRNHDIGKNVLDILEVLADSAIRAYKKTVRSDRNIWEFI